MTRSDALAHKNDADLVRVIDLISGKSGVIEQVDVDYVKLALGKASECDKVVDWDYFEKNVVSEEDTIFDESLDFFKLVASKRYGVPYESITAEMRNDAKIVVFG